LWELRTEFQGNEFSWAKGNMLRTVMLEAKTYRQYAADCIRIAEKMDVKDKQILLKIAEAWNMRADEADRREIKINGQGPDPGTVPG
jgi:hypothetical protein